MKIFGFEFGEEKFEEPEQVEYRERRDYYNISIIDNTGMSYNFDKVHKWKVSDTTYTMWTNTDLHIFTKTQIKTITAAYDVKYTEEQYYKRRKEDEDAFVDKQKGEVKNEDS